jgi:hypothetical protein
MSQRTLVLTLGGIVVIAALVGGGLWWWQTHSTAPTVPRYRPAVQTPLKTDDPNLRAVLVVLQLGSGEDLRRVVRHYLQQNPGADFYQFIAPEGNILALRTATFSSPDALPQRLRQRLAAWPKITPIGREGPYTLYRLERGS